MIWRICQGKSSRRIFGIICVCPSVCKVSACVDGVVLQPIRPTCANGAVHATVASASMVNSMALWRRPRTASCVTRKDVKAIVLSMFREQKRTTIRRITSVGSHQLGAEVQAGPLRHRGQKAPRRPAQNRERNRAKRRKRNKDKKKLWYLINSNIFNQATFIY